MEENARLLAEAKEQEKTVQEERFEETVQTDAYNVSYDDAYLLACLVYAEAGSEPYEGKLATANIVLNRLNSGKYGNTISDVINAPLKITRMIIFSIFIFMINLRKIVWIIYKMYCNKSAYSVTLFVCIFI